MRLDEGLLLVDTKNYIKEIIDPQKESKSSFELLLHSFQYFLDESEQDYENREYAKKIYSMLGWDKDVSYDVINSFYTTFKRALAYSEDLIHNEKAPTKYKFDHNGNFQYQTKIKGRNGYEFYNIGKAKHIKKLLNKENICYQAVQIFNNTENGKLIEQFSGLCHCIANFMPCPKDNYNEAKGFTREVGDYLPLMVDKIQECIDQKHSLEYKRKDEARSIQLEILEKWQKWFIENREKYSLEPYYYIREGKIIGIPLFKNQSLKQTYPMNSDEVKECLIEIIKRIKERDRLISLKYND